MTPTVRHHVAALCLAAATSIALLGCASAPPRGNLNYADRARAEYELAMDQFNGGDFLEAADMFRKVRHDYGLSRWAWLSELRLADIDFKTDRYAEAIQAFRSWIRYHPTQPEVDYARYMIARCYYAQIPADWALVPSSYERDQSATHDAEEQLERFIADFPRSTYASDARDYLRRTREYLARAEMSVAQFYLTRERPEAAISRLRVVLETYDGSGLEPEALLQMGQTYLLMGRRPEAQAAFNSIIQRYPRSAFVQPAQRYLRFMGPDTGTPASTSPAAGTPAAPGAGGTESNTGSRS